MASPGSKGGPLVERPPGHLNAPPYTAPLPRDASLLQVKSSFAWMNIKHLLSQRLWCVFSSWQVLLGMDDSSGDDLIGLKMWHGLGRLCLALFVVHFYAMGCLLHRWNFNARQISASWYVMHCFEQQSCQMDDCVPCYSCCGFALRVAKSSFCSFATSLAIEVPSPKFWVCKFRYSVKLQEQIATRSLDKYF